MSISILVFSKENQEFYDFPLGSHTVLSIQFRGLELENFPKFYDLLAHIDYEGDYHISGNDIQLFNNELETILHSSPPFLSTSNKELLNKYLDFFKFRNTHMWEVTIR